MHQQERFKRTHLWHDMRRHSLIADVVLTDAVVCGAAASRGWTVAAVGWDVRIVDRSVSLRVAAVCPANEAERVESQYQ